VWTIPKRLRIYYRHDRPLLGRLAQLAWETVLDTYREMAGNNDALPGMIAGIQTFGELLHFHPHVHALVTDGVFLPNGTFRQLPEIDTDAIHDRWRRKVFDLLLSEGKIDQETIDQMTTWQHSGFSVDRSVYLSKGDVAGLERLAEYMVRCPLSLARMTRVTDEGSVSLSPQIPRRNAIVRPARPVRASSSRKSAIWRVGFPPSSGIGSDSEPDKKPTPEPKPAEEPSGAKASRRAVLRH
jgi:hypothetical protein